MRGRFPRIPPPELDVLVAILLAETLRLLEEDLKEIEDALGRLKRTESKLRGAVRSTNLKASRTRPAPASRTRPAPASRTRSAAVSRGTFTRRPKAIPGSKSTWTPSKTGHLGITYHELPPGADECLVGESGTTYDSGSAGNVTVQGLKSLLDEMKGKLDGMNEMSEMTSLRLQMTMDRRSKFISTLSQIMKKISTTQDTLTQNIK